MKKCPRCRAESDDNAQFCIICGAKLAAPNNGQQGSNSDSYRSSKSYPETPIYNPYYDPYDHTAEFDPKDISDNKVMSMIVYLMGWIGIIIALLGSHSSPYAAFHVRQALKFEVVNVLMLVCALLLFWTILVPLAYVVMAIVFLVIRIICFFQICSGKAKEPAIIRSLGFLR